MFLHINKKLIHFPGQHPNSFIRQQVIKWFSPKGVDHKAIPHIMEESWLGERLRKRLFINKMMGKKLIDPCKPFIVGCQQQVKQFILISYLYTSYRFYPCFPA